MSIDFFGLQKDENIDKEWKLLVNKLEASGWEKESFTTLYEEGKLFIPDAPEAEMSRETPDFLFNVTTFLSEKNIYLIIAPGPPSNKKGQLTVFTRYGNQLELWLEQIIRLVERSDHQSLSTALADFYRFFPDSFLDIPVDGDTVSVPIDDPIAQKVLQMAWSKDTLPIVPLLDESDRERLKKLAKTETPSF